MADKTDLMDEILPNGVRLGDAKAADLEHAIAFYEREGKKAQGIVTASKNELQRRGI